MITTDRAEVVSLLRIQRHQRRNAINLQVAQELWQAVQTEVAAGMRVLVITGEGSAFSAGADLDGVYGDEFTTALYELLHGITTVPIPVIAAVNGAAIGAGTQLAMAADLRIGAPTAKFAVPTVRNAMAVDAWTIRRAQTLAGGGMARRMLIGGETIDLDAALDCGLVDRAGDLDAARAWADELSTFAPLALAYNKLVLNDGAPADIEAGFAACWASDDVQEALAARAEKRAPVFQGR